MSMPERRWMGLLGLLLALCTGTSAAECPRVGSSGEQLGIVDVLDQVERARRIEPDNATLLREGLVRIAHPLAELELAFLEIYGPVPVLAPDSGLERLATLSSQGACPLSPQALVLLELIQWHEGRLQAMDSNRQWLTEQLEAERQAHLETRQKLDALRRIEQQLEPAQAEFIDPDSQPTP